MLLGTQRVNAHGHLEIGGCDAVELARQFGTPLYVMDEQAIRDNCRRYKAAFETRYPKNEISFASKAYLNMAICKLMQQEGVGLDVASAGELYTAVKATTRWSVCCCTATTSRSTNCRWRSITASGASSWITSWNCASWPTWRRRRTRRRRFFCASRPALTRTRTGGSAPARRTPSSA